MWHKKDNITKEYEFKIYHQPWLHFQSVSRLLLPKLKESENLCFDFQAGSWHIVNRRPHQTSNQMSWPPTHRKKWKKKQLQYNCMTYYNESKTYGTVFTNPSFLLPPPPLFLAWKDQFAETLNNILTVVHQEGTFDELRIFGPAGIINIIITLSLFYLFIIILSFFFFFFRAADNLRYPFRQLL